jgi:putative tryptophan/tyrosine transport system substrate-binding protein
MCRGLSLARDDVFDVRILAQSGGFGMSVIRSLSGEKQTWDGQREIDAFDPTETLAALSRAGLSRYDACPEQLVRMMKRRDFITLLGSTAVAWPRVVVAQQPQKVRHIGAMINRSAGDPEATDGIAAFSQGLGELGWTIGGNVRIEFRFGVGDADAARKNAVELIALAPDVILATGTVAVAALQQLTQSIPIVFTVVTDPVAAGFVDSIAHPGGNITGFMQSEYSLNSKLLELLKQIAPRITHAAVLRDLANPAGISQFSAIQAVASSQGVIVSPVSVRDANEIERGIEAAAHSTNGGLIVTGSASVTVHRDLIVALAARYKIPAIYSDRFLVVRGGLISYGPERIEQFRHAAGYVDRILKGEKPANLPVQAPTKYELVVNLKTAKALGLTLPATLLASADEVIE